MYIYPWCVTLFVQKFETVKRPRSKTFIIRHVSLHILYRRIRARACVLSDKKRLNTNLCRGDTFAIRTRISSLSDPCTRAYGEMISSDVYTTRALTRQITCAYNVNGQGNKSSAYKLYGFIRLYA